VSTLQWTFLAAGLGLLALGASGLLWTDAWERHGVESKPFGIEGTGALMCVVGVLFLIAIAAVGLGTFMACVLESSKGLGELAGDVFWLGIAIWLLGDGIFKRNVGELGVAAFMLSVVGLLGLLTWVFHSEHAWVKPITDFCGCF
jgi:hypothetical protein